MKLPAFVSHYDLAWGAGYLDGEGCFYGGLQSSPSIMRNNPILKVTLSAANVKKEPAIKLKAMFGGAIHYRREQRPNQRRTYNWSLNGSQVIYNVLEELLPYLVVKRNEALKLMEICERIFSNRDHYNGTSEIELETRRQLVTELKELKRNGRNRNIAMRKRTHLDARKAARA